MSRAPIAGLAVFATVVLTAGSGFVRLGAAGQTAAISTLSYPATRSPEPDQGATLSAEQLVGAYAQARLTNDLAALQGFRPGYAFWQHVFTTPDGSIAFGSAVDGRLLAILPARGDWSSRPAVMAPSSARVRKAATVTQ